MGGYAPPSAANLTLVISIFYSNLLQKSAMSRKKEDHQLSTGK